MRILLWIALLLALFGLAWTIQVRWTDARRSERDEAFGSADRDLPAGFGRAVVGAPSGADPVESVRPTTPVPPPRAAPPVQATHANDNVLREHVVARGESLSKICAALYGSSKPEIVAALARRNGIDDPKSLREGQTLKIPPLAELMRRP